MPLIASTAVIDIAATKITPSGNSGTPGIGAVLDDVVEVVVLIVVAFVVV